MLLRILFLSLIYLLSSPVFASTYYWVGGNGSWSDIAHWSSVSGGTANYIVVPGTGDKVIFDANSFPNPNGTESISIPNNVFTGGLEFTVSFPVELRPVSGAPSTLNVYGKIVLNHHFRLNSSITLKWITQAGTGNQINIPGVHLPKMEIEAPYNARITDICRIDDLIIREGNVTISSDSIFIAQMSLSGTQSKKVEILSHNCFLGMLYTFATTDTVLAGKSRIYGLNYVYNASFNNPSFILFGEIHLGTTDIPYFSYSGSGFRARRIFTGNAHLTLSQDALIDTLTIENGTDLTIGNGNVTIRRLEGSGTCLNPIHIRSANYSRARIAGTLSSTLSNCSIYKMEFTNTINTQQSADLGDNTGINFVNPRVAKKMFWIGNKGYYHDPSHWSLSSGGPPSNCLPWPVDTVVFDAASFSVKDSVLYDREIHIAGIISNCDNLAAFASVIGQLPVTMYGSFSNYKKETDLSKLLLKFLISKTAFLKTSGSPLAGFSLRADNNELVLLDDTLQTGHIQLENGILDISNRTVNVSTFSVQSYGSTVLKMKNTRIKTGFLNLNLTLFPSVVITDGSEIEVNYAVSAYCGNHYFPVIRLKREANFNTYSDLYDMEIGRLELDIDGLYDLNRIQTDTFKIHPGTKVMLTTKNFQVRKMLEIKGNCLEPVYVMNETRLNEDATILLRSAATVHLDYITSRRLALRNKPGITATNSVDIDGSSGFNITPVGGKKMYWVAGKGDWKDPAHWSYSSGGGTASCLPTLNDTVVFDQNSFLSTQDTVFMRSPGGWGCKVLDMKNVNVPFVLYQKPDFVDGLLVRNSAYFSPYMSAKNAKITFYGSDPNSEVDFNNLNAPALTFEFGGSGSWNILTKPKQIGVLRLMSGEVHLLTDSLKVQLLLISPDGVNFPLAKLFFHRCVVSCESFQRNEPGTFSADSAVIFFSNRFETRISINQKEAFYKVIRINTPNEASMYTEAYFRYLEIDGDMIMGGNITADSLVIYNAGRVRFNSGFNYEVKDYFRAAGNNCHKIQLQGINGSSAMLVSNAAKFDCDHLIISNLPAIGSAGFTGGAFTQLSGNTGAWTKGNSSTMISRLSGRDIFTCMDSTFVDIEKLYGRASSYQWSTGDTTAKTWFRDTGYHYLKVSYPGSCELRDTLHIVSMTELAGFLPADTLLCGASSFNITPLINIPQEWDKRWNNGTTQSTLSVNTNGTFSLTINNNGCVSSDTINVRFSRLNKELLYTSDTSFCKGDSLQVKANISINDSFTWTDGNTSLQRWFSEPGIFRLHYYDAACIHTDSITVKMISLDVNVSGDSIFCRGDSVQLDASPALGVITWSNGHTGPSFQAGDSGWCKVVRSEFGCKVTDSIYLSVREKPYFDLLPDTSLCEGDSAFMQVKGEGYSWLWSDNSSDSSRWLKDPATYVLTARNAHCAYTDTLRVSGVSLPSPFIANKVLCSGTILTIPIPSLFGENYLLNNRAVSDTLKINDEGTYRLRIVHKHCERTDSFEVSEKGSPLSSLPDSLDFCELENGLFEPQLDPGITLFWEGNEVTSSSILLTSPGIYGYELRNSDNCFTEATLPVKGCGCRIIFPNAFTPNNDLFNPDFAGQGCQTATYNLKIYNRWGELLFESDDPQETWNGTYKGRECPEGVYVWVVRYNTFESLYGVSRVNEKGSVTLLR